MISATTRLAPPPSTRAWIWIAIGAAAALLVVAVVIAALVSNGDAGDAPDRSATQTSNSVEEVEPAPGTVEPVPVEDWETSAARLTSGARLRSGDRHPRFLIHGDRVVGVGVVHRMPPLER